MIPDRAILPKHLILTFPGIWAWEVGEIGDQRTERFNFLVYLFCVFLSVGGFCLLGLELCF